MTRVNKGNPAKAGRPKLVCTKAKVGSGCSYISVPVAEVEDAIKSHWGTLFADVPSSDGDSQVDRAHRDLDGAVMATEDLLQDLSDAFGRTPSSVLAQRIARVEAELRIMRVELQEIDEKRRLADKGLIRARLDDLWELVLPEDCDAEKAETALINTALKVLFSGVIVDYDEGLLRFQWRQGGETAFIFAWRD